MYCSILARCRFGIERSARVLGDDKNEEDFKPMTDEALSALVDGIIDQMDLNLDGFVDYGEYRKVNSV